MKIKTLGPFFQKVWNITSYKLATDVVLKYANLISFDPNGNENGNGRWPGEIRLFWGGLVDEVAWRFAKGSFGVAACGFGFKISQCLPGMEFPPFIKEIPKWCLGSDAY